MMFTVEEKNREWRIVSRLEEAVKWVDEENLFLKIEGHQVPCTLFGNGRKIKV